MQKNYGLDIARSVAILFVLIAHLSPFFKNNILIFNLLYHSGLYGVELFFVLSGFLIGQTLLVKVAPLFSFKEIKKFYISRLLKIIPLYYFVLICFILVDNFIFKTKYLHLYHFIFLQNFFQTETAFFAVSWTLSIQFWFYLIAPIVFLMIGQKKYSPKKLIMGFIVIIIVIILLRLGYVCLLNPSFDFGIRKNILARLDSLFIGVFFAILKLKYKLLYNKLASLFPFIISLVTLMIFYLFYVYKMIILSITFFDKSIFFRVFSWPLISFMLIIFVIHLENSKFVNNVLKNKRIIYGFFTKLSTISFSIFLIHYEIYNYFENNLKHLNVSQSIIISTTIIVTLSFLLYNFIEKPILLEKTKFKTHA